jgi:glycosyltransferase involved in cell wall biosynthesis
MVNGPGHNVQSHRKVKRVTATTANSGSGYENEPPRREPVSLVIPTLNEIEGMRVIMPRVKREWVDQILILDGGSTDGTVEWAEANGYEVHVQEKPGIRQAYMEALPRLRGEIIVTFSPDGNSIPELLPDLIAKIREGYDMVIVSRYLDAARSEDDDWLTGFGNWLFTKTVNVLHRGRYTDAMVIYRAYRKEVIRELELDQDRWYSTPERLFGCRISWEPMLSARAARRGLRVTEIPGDEPPRVGGERKLRVFRWGASYYYQFIRDALLWPRRGPTTPARYGLRRAPTHAPASLAGPR